MEQLIPNDAVRAEVEAEQPSVPLRLFESTRGEVLCYARAMASGRPHFEPFVHLVDVTERRRADRLGRLLPRAGRARAGRWSTTTTSRPAPAAQGGTIGAQSASYGQRRGRGARRRRHGRGPARPPTTATTSGSAGLAPDTAYRYRITVDGRALGAGTRTTTGCSAPTDRPAAWSRARRRATTCRFRTHPDDDDPVPGDASSPSATTASASSTARPDGARQAVARTLEHLAARHPVRVRREPGRQHLPRARRPPGAARRRGRRLVLHRSTSPTATSSTTCPLYPTAGNHDGSDEEASDDREQLADNFHLEQRFGPRQDRRRASLEPGLFYRLNVGVAARAGVRRHHLGRATRACTTSTTTATGPGWRSAAAPTTGDAGVGRAEGPAGASRSATTRPTAPGPTTSSMPEQLDSAAPALPAGRRAAGAERPRAQLPARPGRRPRPRRVGRGRPSSRTRPPVPLGGGRHRLTWAAEPHCLLVEVDDDRLVVTPYGALDDDDGEPQPIERYDPDGTATRDPIVLEPVEVPRSRAGEGR